GLSGNELLLQTRQHQLSFGHRQPQTGEIAETARAGDPHDVDPLLITIGPDFYQPHSPGHATPPPYRPAVGLYRYRNTPPTMRRPRRVGRPMCICWSVPTSCAA